MKIVLIYHPESEHSRLAEEYMSNFERTRHKTTEPLSLETKAGDDIARLYGITHYPALLAIRDDGQLLKNWEGETLPLMDEVAGYIVM